MDLDNTIDGLLWVSAFRSLCKVRTGVDKTNETWPSGNTDCKDTIKDISTFSNQIRYTDVCNILHALLVKHYNDLLDRQSSQWSRDKVT